MQTVNGVDRSKSVGASEVAALFGCSPWESEYSLWARKCGLLEPTIETERMRMGKVLERSILSEWADRNEFRVVHNATQFKYEQDEHITATPDGLGYGIDYGTVDFVVDVKTVDASRRRHWDNGVPQHYHLQLQQQMLVAGAKRGYLVALFGFNELSHELVEADPKIHEQIIHRVKTFWDRVEGRLPPPEVDGHTATTAALKRTEVIGKTITLPSRIYDLSLELDMVNGAISELAKKADGLKNKVKVAMGDASEGVFADGSGWKFIKVRGSTVTREDSIQLRRFKGAGL